MGEVLVQQSPPSNVHPISVIFQTLTLLWPRRQGWKPGAQAETGGSLELCGRLWPSSSRNMTPREGNCRKRVTAKQTHPQPEFWAQRPERGPLALRGKMASRSLSFSPGSMFPQRGGTRFCSKSILTCPTHNLEIFFYESSLGEVFLVFFWWKRWCFSVFCSSDAHICMEFAIASLLPFNQNRSIMGGLCHG